MSLNHFDVSNVQNVYIIVFLQMSALYGRMPIIIKFLFSHEYVDIVCLQHIMQRFITSKTNYDIHRRRDS